MLQGFGGGKGFRGFRVLGLGIYVVGFRGFRGSYKGLYRGHTG